MLPSPTLQGSLVLSPPPTSSEVEGVGENRGDGQRKPIAIYPPTQSIKTLQASEYKGTWCKGSTKGFEPLDGSSRLSVPATPPTKETGGIKRKAHGKIFQGF